MRGEAMKREKILDDRELVKEIKKVLTRGWYMMFPGGDIDTVVISLKDPDENGIINFKIEGYWDISEEIQHEPCVIEGVTTIEALWKSLDSDGLYLPWLSEKGECWKEVAFS